MLLRQLEYLVALARERHFGRAAQACHVSQPSLSGAIRTLERELDAPLVNRGRRFDGLTPEGERVLLWAHRILAERDGLVDDLAAMRQGLTGTLRIAAIPTALTAASLLTAPFCQRHPHARVSMQSLSSREIAHGLAEFELDVALTYLDGEELGRVRRLPVYEEQYLLLAPDDSALARQGGATWEQAAAVPLCLLSQEMRNRRILDEVFAAAGATVTPAIETDSVAALYAHVATRNWYSVVSHAWLHMFGVPAGMRALRLQGAPQAPRIGLVTARRNPESVLAKALVEVARQVDVRAVLARLVDEHAG
ncbi:LysR family transcriptional regulator [Umezawaea tangerina]|uniref:DNA-binding transcriptional LysR family regulator n=1 Tax=Umezawaea tangerina TaxID=84725 RepID=A0A2T0SX55_9PSEU|nr:LysR family transcriptional regulator [Umezawaea tangerina]PRY37998.1 DNA-binding transcriptional LysR family regulator [Umezawaea tangerina]